MEKPAQWVAQICRLYFADIYARKNEGFPRNIPAPGVGSTLTEVEKFLPDLEAKMIEFLAEWMVTLLTQIVKARAPHLAFMVKEYWFREFYLASRSRPLVGREESYTRIIDGQVRCITQEHIPKSGQLIWNVEFLTIFVPAWMTRQSTTACAENASKMKRTPINMESGLSDLHSLKTGRCPRSRNSPTNRAHSNLCMA